MLGRAQEGMLITHYADNFRKLSVVVGCKAHALKSIYLYNLDDYYFDCWVGNGTMEDTFEEMMRVTAQADPRYLCTNRFRGRRVESQMNLQDPIDAEVSKPSTENAKICCFNCGKRSRLQSLKCWLKSSEPVGSTKEKEPATRR